jgi:hypothetical protein
VTLWPSKQAVILQYGNAEALWLASPLKVTTPETSGAVNCRIGNYFSQGLESLMRQNMQVDSCWHVLHITPRKRMWEYSPTHFNLHTMYRWVVSFKSRPISFFSMALQPKSGLGLLFWAFLSHAVGLLRMSDQTVAEASTYTHINRRDKHKSQRDSNPPSQQPSGRIPTS